METVSTLLAEAQKETPPGLAGREDVARFFSNRPTLVMYNMHLSNAVWRPEKGSKAWIDARISLLNGSGLKWHWVSGGCVRSVISTWGQDGSERILDGADFDLVPEHDRCKRCNKRFQEA